MITSFSRRVMLSKQLEREVVGFLEGMGFGKRCAFVCDGNVKDVTAGVRSALSGGFEHEMMIPESIGREYLEGFSKRLKDFDFVIGAGGGRAIDAAKYSSFLAGKRWVAFPTILSHDGVVSSRAVLGSGSQKSSVDASGPEAIMVDVEIIRNAPYRFLAAGVGDLLSNISSVEDWKIAAENGKDDVRPFVSRLALSSAYGVMDASGEIKSMTDKGIETVMWSLTASGIAMNICGSSRPCSGSEHNFSHTLEALGAEALHGEQVALGTLISMRLQEKDWESMRNTMEGFGIPVTAEGIGIPGDMLVEALHDAKNVRERFTVLNLHNMSREKCRSVLEEVGII